MALINCPHCGRQVSDTVEVCIHCGKRVKENLQKGDTAQAPPRKVYEKLTDYERRELEKEFVKGKPAYGKFFDKRPAFEYVPKFITVIFMIGFALAMYGIYGNVGVAKYVGLSIMIICSLSDIASLLALYNYRKQMLIVLKRYQKWLKEKHIDYAPNFKWISGRWRRYFDTVNPDAEDM